MAQSVLVVAESGSGKSTSIENLDPKETFIINVANKPLPFKGWKAKYIPWSKDNPAGNLYSKATADDIIACMKYVNEKRPDIKVIVIDDFQYMSGFEYMEKGMEKGILLQKQQIILKGIQHGLSIETLVALTELSAKEVEEVIKTIKDSAR